MIDPRLAVIEPRLAHVGRILAVTGGKGGIGKSLVSSTLAVALAAAGERTGLLDLDFTGPCDHLVLGAAEGFPEEDFGILPQEVAGVHFMSIATFDPLAPAPLRGGDVSNALIELLAITRWGELDTLVIDMPPGLGDMALDAVQLLPRAQYIVVASPALLVAETVRRSLALLQRLDRQVVGVVENMSRTADAQDASSTERAVSDPVRALAQEAGVAVVGSLPRDDEVEATIGHPAQLLETSFGRAVSALIPRIS